jgi:beta-lactamase superfamily II metal-dependent hydrolase
MGYELEFLPVGDSSGDAICVRYGSNALLGYTVHVVDGGYSDTAQTIIDHIEKYYGAGTRIAHMVLSHADNDHACGLIDVLKQFDVGALWMNRPWLYAVQVLDKFHGNWTLEGLIKKMKEMHPYLVELEKIAAEKGTPVYEVFQGASIGQFTVLAPSRPRYIELIPDLDKTPPSYAEAKSTSLFAPIVDAAKAAVSWIKEKWDIETLDENPPATSASNETSVVQIGVFDDHRVLLTADVGPAGLTEAANYAELLGLLGSLKVVQVPHHGSRRNVTPAVLNRWLGERMANSGVVRGGALCSVGKNKTEHPRRKVSNAFIRRGYPVYCARTGPVQYGHDMPARNWNSATAEPFHEDVED